MTEAQDAALAITDAWAAMLWPVPRDVIEDCARNVVAVFELTDATDDATDDELVRGAESQIVYRVRLHAREWWQLFADLRSAPAVSLIHRMARTAVRIWREAR